LRTLAALAAVLLVLSGTVSAHDVPDDITVQAFLRPESGRLRLLVRVPLTAMRDVDVPTRGPGYLDLERVEPALRHAATLWLAQAIELFEDGRPVGTARVAAVRVSLPSDRAFQQYESALAGVTGPPLDPATLLHWEQGALDALLEYPVHPTHGAPPRLSIRADFRRLAQSVTVVLRLSPVDGAVRAFEWRGDPGLVEIDPRWSQAALSFLREGITHVLSGPDHLLFLLCIAIPLRRLRSLALVVTSFTAAHAITLIGSAYGFAPDGLWFVPLVETLIAVSIVWMALENIVQGAGASGAGEAPVPAQAARGESPAAFDERCIPPGGVAPPLNTPGIRGRHALPAGRLARLDATRDFHHGLLGRRWAITTLFGLVHGFGFSFALRERLQFAGSHLLTSLLAFNAGVEVAQLGVILLAAGAVAAAFRWVVEPRVGAIVLSALAAHTGWHWMIERGDVLRQFPWSSIGASAVVTAGVWLMIAVVAAATALAVRALLDARVRRRPAVRSVDAVDAVESPAAPGYHQEATESVR